MTLESDIQDICARITDLIRGAYKRGEAEAIERLMRAARSEVSAATDPAPAAPAPAPAITMAVSSERKRRAPKGSVGAFVDRVVSSHDGPTVAEIQERAADDIERMIAAGSIRAHLRAGRDGGRYVERRGRWYSSNQEEEKKEEAADPAGGQTASGLWSNQEDHH